MTFTPTTHKDTTSGPSSVLYVLPFDPGRRPRAHFELGVPGKRGSERTWRHTFGMKECRVVLYLFLWSISDLTTAQHFPTMVTPPPPNRPRDDPLPQPLCEVSVLRALKALLSFLLLKTCVKVIGSPKMRFTSLDSDSSHCGGRSYARPPANSVPRHALSLAAVGVKP